jgi:hypothetical protein
MRPQVGEVVKQAHQARRFTLRRLAEEVTKENNTPISRQYLFDIEVHHVPAPHMLRELSRRMELDDDTLLGLVGAADTGVWASVEAHPELTEVVITLFRAAEQRGFEDWDHRSPPGAT